MNDRVWLASYPASGNTWLRMLIGGLSLGADAALDINHIAGDNGIASARPPFDQSTLLDSYLFTYEEIDCLRPQVYADLAPKAGRASFMKVHDAYGLTASGEPLLGGRYGARAGILIVRDPRDVAASLANHNGSTIDKAIDYMDDESITLCGRNDRRYEQLRQKLTSWHGHAASWLDQRDIPIHVLRYEDMQRDTVGALLEAVHFAGWQIDRGNAERAVSQARFENLQAQERVAGFSEWHDRGGRTFFRRGKAGAWPDELTAEQIRRIETAHAPMMKRLGYKLSSGSHRDDAGDRQ